MTAKLTRYDQLVFGADAGTNQLSRFGSLSAGSPVGNQRYNGATITPDIVQSLDIPTDPAATSDCFQKGWSSAIIGNNSPTIEDFNSICYLFTRQVAYLLQRGISEWLSTCTYYIGSVVTGTDGSLYRSITDNNLNNALTDLSNWRQMIILPTSYPATTLPMLLSPGGLVSPGQVTGAQIASTTVTGSNLVNQTITATQIANSTITSSQLAANSITTTQITDANVTKGKLSAANYGVSSSCGYFTVSADGNWHNVTNLSQAITTIGRPVQIMLISDGSGSDSYIGNDYNSNGGTSASIRILRNGSPIFNYGMYLQLVHTSSDTYIEIPSSSYVNTIDVNASAGTNTYSIQISSGAGTSIVAYSKLLVMEL